jgi:hypothetical protein
MLWLQDFWRDECGAVLSAEAVVVGTVVVAGATAGLTMVGKAANEELRDVARSLRSLDQSYTIQGFKMTNGRAFTSGSSFVQEPVAESLKALDHEATATEKVDGKQPDQPKKKKKKKPAQDDAAVDAVLDPSGSDVAPVAESNLDFGPNAAEPVEEFEAAEAGEEIDAETKLVAPGV